MRPATSSVESNAECGEADSTIRAQSASDGSSSGQLSAFSNQQSAVSGQPEENPQRALRQYLLIANPTAGKGRGKRLAEMAAQADDIATPITRRVEHVESRMRQASVYMAQALDHQRNRLQILSWLAGALYCMVVGLSWFWITRSTVRPIEA